MTSDSMDTTAGPLPRRRPWTFLRAMDEAALAVCRAALGGRTAGTLHLVLPSGAACTLAGSRPGPEARLRLTSHAAFWSSLRRGSLGFAEAFMNGTAECDDPVALVAYFIDNHAALSEAGRGFFRVRAGDRAYHARRANTRAGARANIAAHYDLGNAFYALWLDASMTYSSALFRQADATLEAAQAAKYERVLDALELRSGHAVLEIGCGWGEMAVRAVGAGTTVTGLTLSREQARHAEARLAAAGAAGRTEILCEDYRDVTGTFDRIVSLEMIEAVGEENWPAYFTTLHDRLKPGGAAVLQAITIDEALYPRYRSKPDFIQRYIFPGGMLPTKTAIAAEAHAAGLTVETIETFGASYALTLAEWRRRFEAHWPQIAALGFDERFRRTWIYYLCYCEAGFERGTIDVGLYRLRKAG